MRLNMNQEPMLLNESQRAIVETAIREVRSFRQYRLSAVSVRTTKPSVRSRAIRLIQRRGRPAPRAFNVRGYGKNPLFFGENQKGDNRHDALSPAMSAKIIHRHVTDGVELGRAAKLPPAVADFILQHHGTRLIGYFFHKAKEEAERKGEPPPAEADYRYPGPKPQTREAALVMIGDMVVATSRNVTEADAGTLRQLVDKAIQQIAGDGQLLDCDLTLRDLDAISRTFAETLRGIYSARPEAPPDARPALRVLEGVTGRVAGK